MKNIDKVLFTAQQIKQRVAELGKQITLDYQGKAPLMVCILTGATIFFSDLIREIELPLSIDFMVISSYGKSSKSSGKIDLVRDIKFDIDGRDIIFVEDIFDSGYTARFLKNLMSTRNPSSMALCSLLDKPDRREVEVSIEYLGFSIPDEFIVGYGLDFDQKYRNLKDLRILEMPKSKEL